MNSMNVTSNSRNRSLIYMFSELLTVHLALLLCSEWLFQLHVSAASVLFNRWIKIEHCFRHYFFVVHFSLFIDGLSLNMVFRYYFFAVHFFLVYIYLTGVVRFVKKMAVNLHVGLSKAEHTGKLTICTHVFH